MIETYLPAVLNKDTGEVCIDPAGSYLEFAGAMHGLMRQTEYVESHKETRFGKPIIVKLEVDEV